ncbi:hypothetical protein BGW41_005323 [Actinomortierella wolfii]|nr:hypothetical protein BGW41_005323 [Actinomortierella wolfii]
MLQYLGSTLADQKRVLRAHKKTERWLFPLCCMKYNPSRLHFLQFMKWGILQYVPLKVFTTFLAIVLESQGTYCEESWSPKFGHVWVLIIDFTAIMFYVTIHKDLKKYQPLLKFLAIKLVIFFSFWQMVAIEGLVYFNVIKESEYWTTSNIATGLNAFIIDIEMFGFALLHLKAYSYKPYVPRKPVPPKDKSPLTKNNNKDPSSLSRLGSMDNIDLEKNDPRPRTTTPVTPGTRRERHQETSQPHQDDRDAPKHKYPDLSSPKNATVASSTMANGMNGYKSKRPGTKGDSTSNSSNNKKKEDKLKGKDEKKKSKAPEKLLTKAEREALMDYDKKTPIWKGLVDAFNPLDTIRELWYGFRYLYRWCRGLPVDRDHQRLMDLETAFGRTRPEPGLGKLAKEGKDKKKKKKDKKSKKKNGKDGSEDDDDDDDDNDKDEKTKKSKKSKKHKDGTDDEDDDGDEVKKKKKRSKDSDGSDIDSDDADDSSDTKSIEIDDAYTIDDGTSSNAGDDSDPDNIRDNPNVPGYSSSKGKRRHHDRGDSQSHGQGVGGSSSAGQGGMTNKERMEEKAKLVVVTKKGVEYLPKEAASRTELAHVPSIKLKPVKKKELLSGLYAAHPHLRNLSSTTPGDAHQDVEGPYDYMERRRRPSSPLSRDESPEVFMPHPYREPQPQPFVDRDMELGDGSRNRGVAGYDPYTAFGTPPFEDSRFAHRYASQHQHLAPEGVGSADEQEDKSTSRASSSMFYHSREASHSDPDLLNLTHTDLSTTSHSRHHDKYVEQMERLEKERQLYHFHQQQELWRQHLEQLEEEQRREHEAAMAAAAAAAATTTPHEDHLGEGIGHTEHTSAAIDTNVTPKDEAMTPTDPGAPPRSVSSISPVPDRPPPLPDKDGKNDTPAISDHPLSKDTGAIAGKEGSAPRTYTQEPQPRSMRRPEPVRRYSMDSLTSSGSNRGGSGTGGIRGHDYGRRPYPVYDERQRSPPLPSEDGEASHFAARRRFYQQLPPSHHDPSLRSRPPPSRRGDSREREYAGGIGGGPSSARMPYPPAPAVLPHHPYASYQQAYGPVHDSDYDAAAIGGDPRASDPQAAFEYGFAPSSHPPPLRLPTSMPVPYGRRGRYAAPPGPPSPETLLPVSRYAPPHLREYEYQQWLDQQRRQPQQEGGRSGAGAYRGGHPYGPGADDMGYDTRRPYHRFPNHRDYQPQPARRDYYDKYTPPHHENDAYNYKERGRTSMAPHRAGADRDRSRDYDNRDPYRDVMPAGRQSQHPPYEHVIEMHQYHDPVPFHPPQQPPPRPVPAHDDYDGPYEEAIVMTRATNATRQDH